MRFNNKISLNSASITNICGYAYYAILSESLYIKSIYLFKDLSNSID